MADFIKSVLVFTLLVTVMKGLINSDSFRMYFKFFSGLVLILVMLGPLVNFLSGGGDWYSLLEQEIFNFNLEGINDELEVADGKFEEIVKKEFKENIKEQVKKLAENRNIDVKDIDIGLMDKDGSLQVASVGIGINKDGAVKEDLSQDSDSTGNIQIEDIEEVVVGSGDGTEAVDAMSDESGRKPASGKNVWELKKDISSYFIIKEAAVNIWE